MTPRRLTVATCQYPVENIADWVEWQSKLDEWMGAASACGAQLAVFPEYAGLELLGTLPVEINSSLRQQLDALQGLLPQYVASYAELAQKHGLYVLAGSFPERANGQFVNRARLFTPEGHSEFAEKLIMTPFERAWGVAAGNASTVYETDVGTIGVAICYDSEFPALVRHLAENGAELVLVPSCTDTVAGSHRVRIACQARALENQCFVAQACTVGWADCSAAIDENHGVAGIYAPPDNGLPENGVIACGQLDEPSWVHAELDFALLEEVRTNGQMRNFTDWTRENHFHASVRRVRCD